MKRSGPAGTWYWTVGDASDRPLSSVRSLSRCGAGTVNTLSQEMEAQFSNKRSFLRWVEGRNSAPSCVIDRK